MKSIIFRINDNLKHMAQFYTTIYDTAFRLKLDSKLKHFAHQLRFCSFHFRVQRFQRNFTRGRIRLVGMFIFVMKQIDTALMEVY